MPNLFCPKICGIKLDHHLQKKLQIQRKIEYIWKTAINLASGSGNELNMLVSHSYWSWSASLVKIQCSFTAMSSRNPTNCEMKKRVLCSLMALTHDWPSGLEIHQGWKPKQAWNNLKPQTLGPRFLKKNTISYWENSIHRWFPWVCQLPKSKLEVHPASTPQPTGQDTHVGKFGIHWSSLRWWTSTVRIPGRNFV